MMTSTPRRKRVWIEKDKTNEEPRKEIEIAVFRLPEGGIDDEHVKGFGKGKAVEPPAEPTPTGGASGAAVSGDEPQPPATAKDKGKGKRTWRR